jgi:hypothetical protein
VCEADVSRSVRIPRHIQTPPRSGWNPPGQQLAVVSRSLFQRGRRRPVRPRNAWCPRWLRARAPLNSWVTPWCLPIHFHTLGHTLPTSVRTSRWSRGLAESPGTNPNGDSPECIWRDRWPPDRLPRRGSRTGRPRCILIDLPDTRESRTVPPWVRSGPVSRGDGSCSTSRPPYPKAL